MRGKVFLMDERRRGGSFFTIYERGRLGEKVFYFKMNGRESRREQVVKKINGRGEGLKEDDRKMDVEGLSLIHI